METAQAPDHRPELQDPLLPEGDTGNANVPDGGKSVLVYPGVIRTPYPRHGRVIRDTDDKMLMGASVMDAFDWLETVGIVQPGIKERYAKIQRKRDHNIDDFIPFCRDWNSLYDLWTFRFVLTFGQATLLIIILPLGTIVDVSCSCFFAFNGGETFDELQFTFPLYFMLPFMLSMFALLGSTALILWIDVFNSPALTDFRATLLFAFFPSFSLRYDQREDMDTDSRCPHPLEDCAEWLNRKITAWRVKRNKSPRFEDVPPPVLRRLQLFLVLILDVLPFMIVAAQVHMNWHIMDSSLFFYLVFEAHIASAVFAAMLYFLADVTIALRSCDWNPGEYSAQRKRNVLDFLMQSYHIKLTRVHSPAWRKVHDVVKIMLHTNKSDEREFAAKHKESLPMFKEPGSEKRGLAFWVIKRLWEHGHGYGYLLAIEFAAWTASCVYLRMDSESSHARGVDMRQLGLAIFLLVSLAFSLGLFLHAALPELRGAGHQYNAVLLAYLVVAGILAMTAGGLPLASDLMSSSTANLNNVTFVGPGFRNELVDLNPLTAAESALPFKTHYPVCNMRWGSGDSQLSALDLAGLAKAVYLEDGDIRLTTYSERLEHIFPTSHFDWTLEYVSDGWPRYSYVYFAPKDPAGRGTRVVSIKGTSNPQDVIMDVYFMANIVTVETLNKALLPVFFFVRPNVMEKIMSFKLWSMKLNNTKRTEWLDPTIQHINQTQQDHPGDDMVVTGHSLGGFMAQIIGANLDVPVLAWSGMGTKYNSGMIHPYLRAFYDMFPTDSEPVMRSIVNVIPEKDPVPKCGVHMGSVVNIRCLGFNGNPFACHILDRTMCELVRVCDDKVGRNFTDYCAKFLDPSVLE